MITRETVRIKTRRFYMQRTAGWRRRKVTAKDWTIISNNCWGGFIYQSYGMPYMTPTVGCFFMAEDYLRMIRDLRRWMSVPLEFISAHQSCYEDYCRTLPKFGAYPVGILADGEERVEIHFLHYTARKEAGMHWQSRVKRINWNKLLYKFNDQNLCTDQHLAQFSQLPLPNKLCFTSRPTGLPGMTYIKCPKGCQAVPASYEPFGSSRICDVNRILNSLEVSER